MSSLMFFSFFRCPFRCLLLVNLNVILRVELVSLLMQLILVTLWPKVIRKYRMLDTHFCLALQAVFTSCTFNLFIPFCRYFRNCWVLHYFICNLWGRKLVTKCLKKFK